VKVQVRIVFGHTKGSKYICWRKPECINLQLPSSHEKPADFLRSISYLAHSTVCKTLISQSQSYSWGFALYNLVIACLISRSYARFHHLILEARRSHEFHAGRQTEGSSKVGILLPFIPFQSSSIDFHPSPVVGSPPSTPTPPSSSDSSLLSSATPTNRSLISPSTGATLFANARLTAGFVDVSLDS